MYVFTRHLVGEMEGGIQSCLLCGETLLDYTNAMFIIGEEPPRGWDSGYVYVSKLTNPTIFLLELSEEDTYEECNK